jgi:hypothetical protein
MIVACPVTVWLVVVALLTTYVDVRVCDVLTLAPKPFRKLLPENALSTPNVCEKLVWLCCPWVLELVVETVKVVCGELCVYGIFCVSRLGSHPKRALLLIYTR